MPRIFAVGLFLNVVLSLWNAPEIQGADPFKLTIAAVGAEQCTQ